jgi:hypothetical protein
MFSESALMEVATPLYAELTHVSQDTNTALYALIHLMTLFALVRRQWEYPNIRVLSQQGRSTLAFPILSDHGTCIDKLLTTTQGNRLYKLTIKADAKPEILERLAQMNINAHRDIRRNCQSHSEGWQ